MALSPSNMISQLYSVRRLTSNGQSAHSSIPQQANHEINQPAEDTFTHISDEVIKAVGRPPLNPNFLSNNLQQIEDTSILQY